VIRIEIHTINCHERGAFGHIEKSESCIPDIKEEPDNKKGLLISLKNLSDEVSELALQ